MINNNGSINNDNIYNKTPECSLHSTSICFPCLRSSYHAALSFPDICDIYEFTNSCLSFSSYPLLINTDSYTKEDIVFKWNATDIEVGTEQMAQFEYKGAKLSSGVKVFDIGKHSHHSPLIVLNSLNPSHIPAINHRFLPSFSLLHFFCLSFLLPSSTSRFRFSFFLPSSLV